MGSFGASFSRGSLGAEALEAVEVVVGGTADGAIGEGHAFDGEALLEVDGLAGGDSAGDEGGDAGAVRDAGDGEREALAAFWEARALHSPVRRPVERRALAGPAGAPAARRSGEVGIEGDLARGRREGCGGGR